MTTVSRALISSLPLCVVIVTLCVAALDAQGPPGGRGAPPPPRTPREAAPVDFTGYWVSVVTEDWRWRMVTPALGDFAGIPLNPAAKKIGLAWNPAKDEADGTQCKSYAAPALLRMPTRLRISWQDDRTLKLETDWGTQTRLLYFTDSAPATAERTWQGYSVARWEPPLRGPGTPETFPVALLPREGARGRALEVVTTQLRPGYLRKNGLPFGASTVLKEYFDLFTEPNGDTWFVVTSIVEDPEHLTTPWVTSSNFKKQADSTGWNPTPCSAR